MRALVTRFKLLGKDYAADELAAIAVRSDGVHVKKPINPNHGSTYNGVIAAPMKPLKGKKVRDCPDCGQPIKPGRHKAGEFEHARGCPRARKREG